VRALVKAGADVFLPEPVRTGMSVNSEFAPPNYWYRWRMAEWWSDVARHCPLEQECGCFCLLGTDQVRSGAHWKAHVMGCKVTVCWDCLADASVLPVPV
jgi:hypothetical protein